MTINETIIRCARRMHDDNFVASSWGNISVRVDDGISITPTGRDYFTLHEEEIAHIRLSNGEILNGLPSSEWQLHAKIYKGRNDVAAIIHIHSSYLSAVSVLGLAIPPLTEDQAMLIGERIAVAPYAPAGSELLATRAVEYLGLNDGVILANHGYVACGRSLDEAYANCRIAEKAAQIFITVLSTGKPFHTVPQPDARSLRDFYLSDYRLRQNDQ